MSEKIRCTYCGEVGHSVDDCCMIRPPEWSPALRGNINPVPTREAPQGVAEVMQLVDQYWAIAYTEGLEKRRHDTPEGDAQRVLSGIRSALTAIVQERDAWKDKYELVRDTDLAVKAGLEQEREIIALEARVAELERDAPL